MAVSSFSAGLGALWAAIAGATTAATAALLACEDAPACAWWVAEGDDANCSKYPGLLCVNCPAACRACSQHEAFRDCAQVAETKRLVASPVGLDELNQGIGARAKSTLGSNLTVLRDTPQMLQMDGFLTPQEARAMVELAERTGFERSERYIDGAADLRTSSTTFCKGPCQWDVAAADFTEKIASVVGIPAEHFEPIQFVRYREGEHYALHSDFIDADVGEPQGPRLLTFFVYLSAGFEGGETAFPELNLKVQPRLGSAVLWGNSFPYIGGSSGRLRWLPNSQTEHEDAPACAWWVAEGDDANCSKYPGLLCVNCPAACRACSQHEALPVGALHAGPKYAANIWIHDGDVRFGVRKAERCSTEAADSHSVEALEL